MQINQTVPSTRFGRTSITCEETVSRRYRLSLHTTWHGIDYFPAIDRPDRRFNSILNTTLATSTQYMFKGVTGRHIPGRLSIVDHHNLNCKILLIDPERQDLLQLYVRDRFGTSTSQSEATSHIQRVKREIYMTVVDLFNYAWWTSIEIKMYSGSVFYRTEIFYE